MTKRRARWSKWQGYKEVPMGKYVDRGDPEVCDFTALGLTIDGAWHDLDFSGIVAEAGAGHLVHFRLLFTIMANDQIYVFRFREKGNVNEQNIAEYEIQNQSEGRCSDFWVTMDDLRKIQYWGFTAAPPGDICIVVRGWTED